MKRFFPQFFTSSFRLPTAGNKMKRSMSRLSLRSPLGLALISFVAAATLITFAVSANRKANGGAGVSPVNHAQDARATKPLTRIANRRTLTPMPLPFVGPNVTATLDDNFPLGSKKNPGDTINYTAVITSTGASDASGITYTDTLDINTMQSGLVRVSPVTVDDSYTCTGNVSISPLAASGVLVNDYSGQNSGPTTIASYGVNGNEQITIGNPTPTAQAGGSVSLNADGSFTYNPPANFTGSDTFHYTLSNATGSSIGLVTITVSDRILFVNGAAGNCKPATPCTFATADALGVPTGKDLVFVLSSGSPYAGATISLNSGQAIAGQKISIGTALTDAGITLAPNSETLNFPASTIPVLNNGGTIVTLGGNNLVEDLSINPTAGNGIIGNNITTGATIRDLTVTGTGAANGITFTGTSTGSTFNLSNIGVTTAGGNALSDVGPGAATTGGTVNATQNNTSTVNTLTSTTGIALNLVNSTIGASGVTFRSISSNGAGSGIVLNNTGSSGGLTVSGDTGSANNSSGGTIQNTTSHGISLTNTQNVSLDQMNIQSTGGSGINGTTVTNFTFTNGTINNSGNVLGESNIAFNGSGSLAGNNISGTLTVTNSTLTNAFDSGLDVQSNDGTISNATITGNTITSSTSTATSKGTGINFVGTGTATTVHSLTKATISGNTIMNFPSSAGIQVNYGNTAPGGPLATAGIPGDATNIISIINNPTITGNSAANRFGTSAIELSMNSVSSGQRGRMNFDVSGNGSGGSPIGNSLGTVILIGNNGYSTMTGTVKNNVIVANNTVASNGIGGGNGIVSSSAETPDLTLTVSGNNISQVDGNGILLVSRGVTGLAKLSIKNNTVAAPLTGVRPGIRVDAGNAASVDDAVCVDISGNTTAGSGNTAGIGLRKQGTNPTINDFGVVGMGATSSPGVETFVGNGAGKNPGSANGVGDGSVNGVLLISATSGFSSCNSAPPIAPPDDGGLVANAPTQPIGNPGNGFEQTQLSNTTLTDTGSSSSPETFAWLRSVLHPVSAFATTLNFLSHSDAPTDGGISARVSNPDKSGLPDRPTPTGLSGRGPRGRASAPSAAKPVTPFSGETVSFSLPVVLNVGKSVTIKYDATVNTPPGAAFVQTQGSVSGSGFGPVLTKDFETGTAIPTKTNINTVITWIGVTSIDWDTASNWDFNYVPVSFSDVKVPNAGQPFHPTLSSSSPTINSLNLGLGRTLTISGQTLTISGNSGSDLTLDGTITGGALSFGAGTHGISNAGGTGSITPTNTTTVLNGANVTLNNNLQADSLTINGGGTLNITGRTLSLTGSLSNGGTFTLTGSTVIFNGTGAQTLTNTTAFNNLTINNTGGSVTLGSNATVNGTLTLTSDLTTTNAFTLTMPLAGIISGGADVVGNFTRTNGGPSLPTGMNIAFGNPNTTLNFIVQGTVPTSINFRLTKTAPTDAATGGTNTGFPGAVQRTWLITPTGGVGFKATMQLHYLIGDLGSNVETNPGPGATVSLRMYKYVINSPSTGWQQQDFPNFANTTIDTSSPGNHFVKYTNVTSFSPWTIGGVSPTAATSTVSGRITDDAGNPVEGAVIRLSGTQNRKTITDASGNYTFFDVETNGFYTVTPSRVNYNFAPATRGFSALGAHTEASFAAALNGNHQNPLDTTEYFVRQQYVDFLGREPEEKGFNDWTDTINNCTPGDASCDRVHVSEAFFRSEEFQQRGYFVYRFYSTAFGQKPDYSAFAPDLGRVSGFLDATQLEAAKTQFASDFTARAAFVNQYGTLSNSAYVDALSQTAGVTLSNRQALVNSLEAGTMTRAQALRQIVESGEVYAKYYNQAFVVMEYFGYLRRDPDLLYLNWISVLDANPADSRHMVEGFVDATEYRNRFKQ